MPWSQKSRVGYLRMRVRRSILILYQQSILAVPEAIPNPPASLSSSPYSTAILPGNGRLTQGESNISDIELMCSIDVDEITTRWMKPYIPGPGEKVRSYPAGVVSFISRMLNSYTTAAIRGRDVVTWFPSLTLRR